MKKKNVTQKLNIVFERVEALTFLEKEKMLVTSICLFPTMFAENFFLYM